jgi:hypothetical protein
MRATVAVRGDKRFPKPWSSGQPPDVEDDAKFSDDSALTIPELGDDGELEGKDKGGSGDFFFPNEAARLTDRPVPELVRECPVTLSGVSMGLSVGELVEDEERLEALSNVVPPGVEGATAVCDSIRGCRGLNIRGPSAEHMMSMGVWPEAPERVSVSP